MPIKDPEKEIVTRVTTSYAMNSKEGREAFLQEAKERARLRNELGGAFGATASIAENECRHVLAGSDDPEARKYAEQIQRLITDTRQTIGQARDHDTADMAAATAFNAGVAWAMAKMKWEWEPSAITGEAVRSGQKAAGAETNKRHVPLREKRFARMRELVPERGVDSAAAACAAEGLGTPDAIKKQWNRHHKK